MPPLISFETGRKHKLNLLFKTTRWSATANGSLVLLKQEPRLRGQHTRRRIRKDLHPRSSVARRESFCPLDKDLSWKSGSTDKDLSWKSGNRKLNHYHKIRPSKFRFP